MSRFLRAPIDGTVQQLALHMVVGGVVTPARQLMDIVPADRHPEAEAIVANRDIGFVSVGQAAEMDTFYFARYKLLRGRVVSVTHDAIVRYRPN